jgi:hypothetical protein
MQNLLHGLKRTCKRILWQLFICLRPPPRLGVVKNFVASESGHIQSVNIQQNFVSNTTQHQTHPPAHNILHIVSRRGYG